MAVPGSAWVNADASGEESCSALLDTLSLQRLRQSCLTCAWMVTPGITGYRQAVGDSIENPHGTANSDRFHLRVTVDEGKD